MGGRRAQHLARLMRVADYFKDRLSKFDYTEAAPRKHARAGKVTMLNILFHRQELHAQRLVLGRRKLEDFFVLCCCEIVEEVVNGIHALVVDENFIMKMGSC